PNEGPGHGVQHGHSCRATAYLAKDIEEIKVSFWNKTLALQRIQIADALRNKVNQDDEESRLILETMEHIVLLSRTIMEYQHQVHQKEQQLIDIKRKRVSLKKDGVQKLQQIKTMMKRRKEEEARLTAAEREKLLDKLEKERQMITVIQNVFQSIIIGSHVNWAEDPSLKAIVLQVENSV
ncbi:CENPH protein, partial [Daphoenositta chrysoptera]|nr:CENPH protein [Daphoenositta chrysoptera]